MLNTVTYVNKFTCNTNEKTVTQYSTITMLI